jgi:hypothetical protein
VDAAFLEWLRDDTEARWRTHQPRDFQRERIGGLDYQRGTRWRGGLTAEQVRTTEQRFGLAFPPDYRLFLTTLHTTDPEMVGARFKGSTLIRATGRFFHDWTGDPAPIRAAIDWPITGLLRSIESDGSWLAAWGPRPKRTAERERLVRNLAKASPQLIPVGGHRYLVGPGEGIGNPVLSIYGADVIVYGSDFADYLVRELRVGGDKGPDDVVAPRAIPFWDSVMLEAR